MTSSLPTLPLTFAGRSLVDGVRMRWGGVGAVVVGIAYLCTGNAAVILGLLMVPLGVATLVFSAFGTKFWYDIPTPQRYVAGVGAVVGFLSFMIALALIWLLFTAIQSWARSL